MKIEKIHNNIHFSYDFITEDELNLINFEKIVINESPVKGNSYYRSHFDLKNIPSYKKKIDDYLTNYKKYELSKYWFDTWINKITIETNKNDRFHLDKSYLTFLTYLNDDFDGGEFLYNFGDESEVFKIKPVKGLTLITNNNLLHKVDKVTSGIRYSMVTFVNPFEKKIKTLI